MRQFIKSLLTNRFGLVLGTLNIVYFFDQLIRSPPFSKTFLPVIFLCMNSPATIVSVLPVILLESLFNLSLVALHQVRIFSFAIFVMIQWLLIAHSARVIALRIQQKA